MTKDDIWELLTWFILGAAFWAVVMLLSACASAPQPYRPIEAYRAIYWGGAPLVGK